MKKMDKDGTIMLVEPNAHLCGQLCTELNNTRLHNNVVCLSDVYAANEYLEQHNTSIFLILQSADAPPLRLENSRNMVYMHERFSLENIAGMFLIHPDVEEGAAQHTFIHCYYKKADVARLAALFTDVVDYWKGQVYDKPDRRFNFLHN